MFSGYIQENPSSGNFPPQPPPSPVRLGNTLIVSQEGNDATAVREDQVYHYLTVDAALDDAQAGDMIIIYPGFYVVTHAQGLCVNDIHIHCMPGSVIAGNLFRGFNYKEFTITGDGTLIVQEPDSSRINLDINVPMYMPENIYIECRNLITDPCFNTTGGRLFIKVNDTLAHNTEGFLYPTFEFNSTNSNTGQHYIFFQSRIITQLRDTSFGLGSFPIVLVNDLDINGVVRWKFDVYDLYSSGLDTFRVLNTKLKMDYLLDIQGDVVSGYGQDGAILAAYGNRFWDVPDASVQPREQPNGYYFRGRIYIMGGNFRNAIYSFGGKIEFTGDIYCIATNCPVQLEGGSAILLIDGYARVVSDGNPLNLVSLVNYVDGGNIVQFQNYRVYAEEFVVKSAVPAQFCNILSCFSNVGLSPDVSNQIIGTNLITDTDIV